MAKLKPGNYDMNNVRSTASTMRGGNAGGIAGGTYSLADVHKAAQRQREDEDLRKKTATAAQTGTPFSPERALQMSGQGGLWTGVSNAMEKQFGAELNNPADRVDAVPSKGTLLRQYDKELDTKIAAQDEQIKALQNQWAQTSTSYAGRRDGREDDLYRAQREEAMKAQNEAKATKEYLLSRKALIGENLIVFEAAENGDLDLFEDYYKEHVTNQANRGTAVLGQNNGDSWLGSLPAEVAYAQSSVRENTAKNELKKRGYTDEQILHYINARNGEGMDALIGDVKEFTAKHPIIAEAAKVATVPVRGIAGALGMVMAPGEKHTGYSLLNEGARAVNETETALISTAIEATANRIGIQGKGAKTLGKLGTLIYSAADSALESAVAMGTGGHLGEVMLGLSAATDAYNEALDNGLPTGRAITTGVVAGAFETLFEHLSLENLRGLSVDTSNVGSFIGKKGFINFLKSAFTEGSEEFFTDIANEAYDYLVNGGYSNFQRTVRDLMAEGMSEEKARKQYARDFGLQLAEDFAVGAMSGGMGFGTRAGVVNARVGAETSNIGRAVRQMGKETEGGVQGVLKTLGSKETEGLTDKSGRYKVGRATLKAFDEYEKRFRQTVKTTAEQAGTENTVKQIDGMLQEAGLHESEAGKVAQAYVDFMTQDKVAYSTLRTIATNENAVEYINNQLSGDNYSAARELRNKILETASEGRINQKIKKKLEKWVHADEFKRAEAQGEVLKKSADAVQTGETAQLITESVKASTADGQVQVKGIAGIENGKIKVTVDESGATDDLDNIAFDETKDGIKGRQIYTAVADMMRGTGDYNVKMSATAANLVIALAQNTDTPVEVFLQDAYEAYKAGTVMRSRDTVEVETDYAISNKEIEAMYAAGAAEYKVQKGVTRIGTQKMTAAQMNMLQVLDRFFMAHNLSLIVVDNLWERTRLKNYRLLGANYTDKQGTDVIVIALNAGKNQENVLDLTAYHELFHWLKKQGPDGRQAAQEMIDGINEGAMAKDPDGYREMVDELKEVGYTADEIAEEIACQYMGTLMSAESFRQKTANDEEAAAAWGDSLPHLKSFYDNVRDYIKTTFAYDKRVQAALNEDVDTAAGWVARFEGTLSYVQANTDKGGQERTQKDYSYAGVGSETADRSLLQQAEQMETEGLDSEEIRQKTGWFRGSDNQWRYEINDKELLVDGDVLFKDVFGEKGEATLGELIEHDALFTAYPQLKSIPVYPVWLPGNMLGGYTPSLGCISVNRAYFTEQFHEKSNEFKETMIHEIQHAIQDIEGFASGASEKYWERILKAGEKEKTFSRKEKAKLRDLMEQYEVYADEDPSFVVEMEQLDASTPRGIPRGKIDWDTLEKVEEDPPEWKAYDRKREQLVEEYGNKVYDFMTMKSEINALFGEPTRTARQLYYDTAGEIEARDTAARVDLTAEQRKEKRPDIDRTDVVFADKNIKFSKSLSGTEGVEETRELLAVHNTSAEKLAEALKWTGLPAPSIAVIKAAMGHDNYGAISLIFDKNTIDPALDRRNRVYGSDAWTPEKATIEYTVDYDKRRDFEKMIADLSGKMLNGVFRRNSVLGNAGVDDLSYMTTAQLAEKISNYDAVRAAYAQEKGIDVKPEYRKKEYDHYGNDFLRTILDTFGVQKVADMVSRIYTSEELSADEYQTLRDLYVQLRLKGFPEGMIRKHGIEKLTKTQTEFANKIGRYKLEDWVRHAWEMYENGDADTDEIDSLATSDNLRAAVDDADVKAWAETKLKGVLKEGGVYNGGEYYDRYGDKRDFWKTHYRLTAENIVKAMYQKSAERGQGAHLSAPGLQSVTAQQYGSIDEIRADRERLQNVEEEKYAEILSDLETDIEAVLQEIVSENGGGYETRSIAEEVILMAAGQKTAPGVKRVFARESAISITEAQANALLDLYSRAANIPTKYFEAKPARVVEWDEIKKVVMPDNTPQEIKDELTKYGIPIEEYELGNEEQRREILNSQTDLRFSRALDQEYMEAVDAGDEETQARLVEQAARASGYNSPVLYHGTKHYGFTRFNLDEMDDGQSIFLTDNLYVAESYSGTLLTGTPGGRNGEMINGLKSDDVYDMPFEKVVKMLNDLDAHHNPYKVINKASLNDLIKKQLAPVYETAAAAMKLLANPERLNDLYKLADNRERTEHTVKLMLQYIAAFADAKTSGDLREAYDNYSKWLKLADQLDDFVVRTIRIMIDTDVLANNPRFAAYYMDLRNKSQQFAWDGDYGVFTERQIRDDLYEKVQSEETHEFTVIGADYTTRAANYALYAKYENPLIVDAAGQNWDEIMFLPDDMKKIKRQMSAIARQYAGKGPVTNSAAYVALDQEFWDKAEELQSKYDISVSMGSKTRAIANYAKDNGYDAVVFEELTDIGPDGYDYYTGDIYVVFDPNQVKSADPVTYDDEGNVIPLSERFNSEEPDIRYSRVIDQDAQEYVERLEQENDAQREEISLLRTMYEELKRVTRERNGKLPKRSRLEEIVKKYIFNDPTDTYHRQEVVDKIYKLLNDVYDGKTSFHSFAWDMRGIVQSEVENAGHWYEDDDSIYKQFRQEFRTQDGNKTRMVTIYIADDIYKTIAEKYGGRAQFRNAMFGKMNVTSDSTRGAMGLDAFYDSLVQGNYGLEETTDPGTQIENILAMWNADPKMWVADNLAEWFGRSQNEVVNDLTMGLISDVVNDANVLMGAETEIYAEKMAEIRTQMRQATQRKIDAAVKAATAAGDRAAAKIQNDPKKTTTEAEAEISAARQQEMQAALARAYEARLRDQAAQMRRSYQTEQEKKEIRRRIRTMKDMLIKNTTTKNVPQQMKGKIKSLIQFFLNDSEIFGKKERHWLEIELARLKTPEENGPTYDFTKFNEQIAEEFANVKAKLEERGGRFGEGMRLRYMTPVQIDIVSAYTENLLHVLQEANESFLEARNGNALEDGETGLQELKKKAAEQKATKNPIKILVKKLLDSGYLTSFYTFNEYIGGVIGEYFQSITRAESNSGLKLREISDFFEGLQKKYKYLNYKKETHLLRLTCYETRAGEEEDRLTHTVTWDVELTTENCMQIYAWYNRELKSGQESAHLVPKVNADGEIVGGGVVLDQELSESQNKALQKLERIKEMRDVGKASKKNEAYLEFLREHGKEANLAADKNRHLLTEEAVEAIIGVLTEEQKQCADEVVHFLSNTGSAWGNAASQKWYGVRLFEEDYYFPYETPAEFSSRRFGMTSEKRLKDWGASKRTMVEAKTPLVLSSFFDVAARHAYEMAMYSEFLVPVEQMSQLLSYKNLELEDASIQSMIKTVYGEKTWSYITEFMDQLNGGVRADDVDSMINRMTSIFKGGAVMANFSVVVQQPTALLRATAMIDPKYLEFGNVNGSRLTTGLKKADYEEMLEYSGVAVLKEMGGFDTNMGNSITAELLGRQTWRSRLNSFTGWGAGKADSLTWTHLWNAVKRETADKHTYHYDPMDPAYEEAANAVKRKQPELDVNSEAFGKAVEYEQMLYDARDRFEDIVRHTQVYDSIITKNKWMRSGGGLPKMVTAFMGEPTLSLNLLLMSGENRTIKRSRAIGAFLANIIVNSLAQGLVGAWRHRDEDETFFESWLEEFVSNLIGDYHVLFLDGAWSPFGMIPWIKDVISMMHGYDVARTDMSAVGELIDAANVMRKRITMGDKDITTWGAPNAEDYADLVFAISKMFGVPAGNVWREIKGITESAKITFGDPRWHFDGMALMDAVERGIGIEQSDQYRAYKAVLHNDAELIRRMTAVDAEAVNKLIEKGYSEDDAMLQAEYDAQKKFDQKVAEGLKRYDPEKRIQAAAQSLYAGEIERYEDIRRGLLEDGFGNNAIQTAIDAAVAELRPPEEKEAKEATEKPAYSTKNLDDALTQNNYKAYNDIAERMIAEEQITQKQAYNRAEKYAQDRFEETLDAAQAKNILTRNAGYSSEDADALIGKWRFEEQHPDSTLNDSRRETWENSLQNVISVERFETYIADVATVKAGTGDVKERKKGVVQLIKAITNDRASRLALWTAAGYGESTFDKEKWD